MASGGRSSSCSWQQSPNCVSGRIDELAAQLLDVQRQLAESQAHHSYVLTEQGWLQQELGRPKIVSDSRSSDSHGSYSQGPTSVKQWDIRPEIIDYLGQADSQHHKYDKLRQLYLAVRGNEGCVSSFVHEVTWGVSKMLDLKHGAAGNDKLFWEPLAFSPSASVPGPDMGAPSVSDRQSAHATTQVQAAADSQSAGAGSSGSAPAAAGTASATVAACAKRSGDTRTGSVGSRLIHMEKPLLVCEMKRPSLLPEPAPDACMCWAKRVEGVRGSFEISPGVWVQPRVVDGIVEGICQLWLYMTSLNNVRWGILTTGRTWYLCKRDFGLQISPPISWDSRDPPLLAAIAFIVECAWADRNEPIPPPPRSGPKPQRYSPDGQQPPDSSEQGGLWGQGGPGCQPPSRGALTRAGGSRSSPRLKGGASGGPSQRHLTAEHPSQLGPLLLQDCPAHKLHIKGEPLAHGWSGRLWQGSFDNVEVVFKLAPRDTRRGRALVNEMSAYIWLVRHWGKHVPKLVHWGTTCEGKVIVLATELLHGSTLAQLGSISAETAEDAMAALSAVHAIGILHGDVRPENVMVLYGCPRPSVRLIDFGFAYDGQSHQQSVEQNKMKQLLDKTATWQHFTDGPQCTP